MKEKNNPKASGILFSSNLSFSATEKGVKPYNGIIYRIILTLLGVLGCSYSLITCFKLPRQDFELVIAAVAFVVVFSILFYIKPAIKFTLPILLLAFAVMVFINREKLWDGILALINYVMPTICEATGRPKPNLYVVNGNPDALIGHLLFYFIFVVSGVVSLATVYRYNFWLAFSFMIPISFCGMAFGLVPSYMAFFALVIYAASTAAVSNAGGTTSPRGIDFLDGGKRYYMLNPRKTPFKPVQLICGLFCGAVFLSTATYLSETNFTRPESVDAVYDFLSNGIRKISSMDFTNFSTQKADEKVTIGDMGGVDFDGEVALRVTVEGLKNPLFLKGYTGSTYMGNGWDGASKSSALDEVMGYFNGAGEMPQNLQSDYFTAASEMPSVVTVENISAPSYIYAPYTAAFPVHSAIEYHQDGMVTLTGTNIYDLSFYDIPSASVPFGGTSPNRFEPSYRKAVHELYTELPSDRFSQIKEKYGKYKSDINAMNIAEVIGEIKLELDAAAEYTLFPGETPKGKDFVEYFLYESKKGYCIYFASAAVVMFRAAGIPARYAAGYVVSPEDFVNGKTAEILDNRGHAWAEIYIDGYGWMPVDVTPGGGESRSPETALQADVSTTVQTTPPVETPPPPAVTTTTAEDAPNAAQMPRYAKSLSEGVVVIAVIILIGIILHRRWKRSIRIRKKSFMTEDGGGNVLSMYDYYKKLLEFSHIPPEKSFLIMMEKIVKEAAFSEHVISPKKQKQMEIFINGHSCIVFELQSWWQKLIMKYIFNLY